MSTPTTQNLYIGNDATVTLSGATGGGSPLTTATVTWELKYKTSGTSIASGSMTGGTGGNYSGTIESSQFSSVPSCTPVNLIYTLNQGAYDGRWVQECIIAERPFA